MFDLPLRIAVALLLACSIAVLRDWRREWPRCAPLLFAAFLFNVIGAAFNFDHLNRTALTEHWRVAATLFQFCLIAAWLFERAVLRLPFRPERRAALRAVALTAPVAATGYGVYLSRTNLESREVRVKVPRLPSDLEGLRIGLISDIHLGALLGRGDLRRAVDALNELRPNLTAITGDFITRASDPLDDCLTELRRLRADAGVVACLGNHEVYAGAEQYLEEQCPRHGIDLLRSRALALQFGDAALNVAGVDYEPLRRRGHYLQSAGSLRDATAACNVLLSHNPDVLPAAVDLGFDLTLAGHTHGGQVNLEFLDPRANPAAYFTPFIRGAYSLRRGDRAGSGYVSRGIGAIALPVRIHSRPEVTAVILERA